MEKKVVDSSKSEVFEDKGKLKLRFGVKPNTIEFDAVKMVIQPNDNDPRNAIFVGYNGWNMSVNVGEEVVVPEFIYEVLKNGNLSNRISKI